MNTTLNNIDLNALRNRLIDDMIQVSNAVQDHLDSTESLEHPDCEECERADAALREGALLLEDLDALSTGQLQEEEKQSTASRVH